MSIKLVLRQHRNPPGQLGGRGNQQTTEDFEHGINAFGDESEAEQVVSAFSHGAGRGEVGRCLAGFSLKRLLGFGLDGKATSLNFYIVLV